MLGQLASNLEASLSSGVDRLLSENRPDQMNRFEWLSKEFSSNSNNYQNHWNQNSRLCKELLEAYVSYVCATGKVWMHLVASNSPGTWRIRLISVRTNTTIHRHLFVQLPGNLNRWTGCTGELYRWAVLVRLPNRGHGDDGVERKKRSRKANCARLTKIERNRTEPNQFGIVNGFWWTAFIELLQ